MASSEHVPYVVPTAVMVASQSHSFVAQEQMHGVVPTAVMVASGTESQVNLSNLLSSPTPLYGPAGINFQGEDDRSQPPRFGFDFYGTSSPQNSFAATANRPVIIAGPQHPRYRFSRSLSPVLNPQLANNTAPKSYRYRSPDEPRLSSLSPPPTPAAFDPDDSSLVPTGDIYRDGTSGPMTFPPRPPPLCRRPLPTGHDLRFYLDPEPDRRQMGASSLPATKKSRKRKAPNARVPLTLNEIRCHGHCPKNTKLGEFDFQKRKLMEFDAAPTHLRFWRAYSTATARDRAQYEVLSGPGPLDVKKFEYAVNRMKQITHSYLFDDKEKESLSALEATRSHMIKLSQQAGEQEKGFREEMTLLHRHMERLEEGEKFSSAFAGLLIVGNEDISDFQLEEDTNHLRGCYCHNNIDAWSAAPEYRRNVLWE